MEKRNEDYMHKKEWIVKKEMELLDFMVQYSGLPKKEIIHFIRQRCLYCNGEPSTYPKKMLQPGDRLCLASTKRSSLPFEIIYEDNELVVINKPAGLLSMADAREKEKTAYHLVGEYLKSKDRQARVFIVHRLDRDTSGVLVFAKNENIKHLLQENWQEIVQKRAYEAIVEGCPRPMQGTIDNYLNETRTQLVYASQKKTAGAKRAITHYRVKQTKKGYSMVDVALDTGRKNQIRVHLSGLGTPIVGDRKYGARSNPLKRLGLHCYEVALLHPVTSQSMVFQAKCPECFEAFFQGEHKK